jgi:L-alanine-DL-glutamate epimerase-like enolase superfamily enzyme
MSKIDRIEAFPVEFPFLGEFSTSRGKVGSAAMGRPSIVLKLTTEDGVVGWGESSPSRLWSYETMETAYTTLTGYLIPAAVGQDLFDVDGLHARMDAVIAPGYTMGQPISRSGIDIAAHDAIGRTLDLPIRDYWGARRRDRIALSWTVAVSEMDAVESSVTAGQAAGYSNFNVKVGHETDLDFDVDMSRRVRELAPDGFLWADANGGYSVATATRAARRLADVGVDVLEQPLPPNALSGYAEMRQVGALPITVDEGVITPRDVIEMIRLGLIDGVAMKPARVGGLLPQRRIIEIVQDAGLIFLGSGLTDPDIGFAASVQVYAAYGLAYPAALNGPQFLDASIASTGVRVEAGEAIVPTGPGLGVTIDEDRLAALVLDLGL